MKQVSAIPPGFPASPEGRTGWPWTVASPPVPPTLPDGTPWPRVSIVTPSFNQASFIEETIRSVLLQGYPNLEYVVQDGGSTDGTVDILTRYDAWLQGWVSQPDAGQCDAIDQGFARTDGEIWAWLNSDDVYAPGAIAAAVTALMAQPGLGAVYADCEFIDSEGRVVGPYPALPFDWHYQLFRGNSIPQPTVFMRRDDYLRVGKLNPNLRFILDYEMWFRFVRFSALAPARGLWARYRLWGESHTIARPEQFILETLALFEQMLSEADWPQEARRQLPRAIAWQRFLMAEWAAKFGQPATLAEYLALARQQWPARHWPRTWHERLIPVLYTAMRQAEEAGQSLPRVGYGLAWLASSLRVGADPEHWLQQIKARLRPYKRRLFAA